VTHGVTVDPRLGVRAVPVPVSETRSSPGLLGVTVPHTSADSLSKISGGAGGRAAPPRYQI
jgi:hypothetical protein